MEGHPPENDNLIVRSKLEAVISDLEQELMAVATRLEIHGLEPGEIARLNESYNDIVIALEALIKEWEEYPTGKKE
jgi:hypothetical protein